MTPEPLVTPNIPLSRWLNAASPLILEQVVKMSGTSLGMYRQWASGRRQLSAAMAGKLADAMVVLAGQFSSSPKPLTRGELCDACKNCPHYKNSCEAGSLLDK
jgi:hypothetical protein